MSCSLCMQDRREKVCFESNTRESWGLRSQGRGSLVGDPWVNIHHNCLDSFLAI